MGQRKSRFHSSAWAVLFETTFDGRNPANQLRLVVYPIIYRVLYIPGGAGFLPSTVVLIRRNVDDFDRYLGW